jgi:fructuronate reductase
MSERGAVRAVRPADTPDGLAEEPALTPRLSLSTLHRVWTSAWNRPVVDPRAARVGIVHLGIGAFHRAHQAVYTEQAAAATGELCWGICGVTQRTAAVLEQLGPQDGLYTVLERGDGAAPPQVIGSVREVLFAGRTPAEVVERIADPAVRVVTLTVTEKGYRRDARGRLDHTDPVVRADLDGGPPRSTVGQLVRGLQRRSVRTGAPLTVLSCDNLTGNGTVLRSLALDFCAALRPAESGPLADWIDSSVRFPGTMVDRIVPAAAEADHEEVRRRLGFSDAGLVVTEPFRQWVVQDDFAADRPAWDKVGALFVPDVTPYETAKLRLLNAAHSLLAYLGALAGHELVSEAVADDTLVAAAAALMTEDAAPTLDLPTGFNVDGYIAQVISRFANPALRHRTVQIAMDGSQKLPVRLLGTVADRLRAGAEPRWAARAVAGWMVYVGARRNRRGQRLPLDDPLAATLAAATDSARTPTALVESLLGIRAIFTEELAGSAAFRQLLVPQVAELLSGLDTR